MRATPYLIAALALASSLETSLAHAAPPAASDASCVVRLQTMVIVGKRAALQPAHSTQPAPATIANAPTVTLERLVIIGHRDASRGEPRLAHAGNLPAVPRTTRL